MSRLLIFLYGVIVYAIMFPLFLYLFAFASGWWVPKTVDTGAAGPWWQALLIDTVLVALFGIQHAIMARPAFKKWWTTIIPAPMERSTFVLIATLLLTLIYWQWQPIPFVLWDVQEPVARLLLHIQSAIGAALVLGSSFLIDHFDLFGLRQVWLHLLGKPYTQKPFVERSVYKVVRHPLMLGFLIAFWSAPTMTVGHALFAGLFTLYIVIGVSMEERDLVGVHGGSYLDYRQRTRKFIPLPRRRKPESPASSVPATS
jgi:protein-S-isoprenylcysteine O-methyltransferase Ste14